MGRISAMADGDALNLAGVGQTCEEGERLVPVTQKTEFKIPLRQTSSVTSITGVSRGSSRLS
jgi:hypothetical protein